MIKVPLSYATKYIIANKWLYFSNQVHTISPKLITPIKPQTPLQPVKVVIIGLSLASALIADKLSECGINVLIVDKNRR